MIHMNLLSASCSIALYLGREYYQEFVKVRYNTGGPGYVLDNTALKVSYNDDALCSLLSSRSGIWLEDGYLQS